MFEQNVITTTGDEIRVHLAGTSKGTIQVRLSDSAIKDWDRCHKYFYYRRMCGLVPKERIQVFDVGTLGHIGCAAYLSPAAQEMDQATRYEMARNRIIAHFDTEMKPKGASNDALKDALRTFPVIMRRRLNTRVITVEQWWEMMLYPKHENGIPPAFQVQFVGKVDAISIFESARYIEEHKFVSASGFGDRKREEYQKSRQTKGYVVLADANLKSDKKTRGVIHNFFLKKTSPDLKQFVTYVGPKDIERFKQSVIETAEEIITAQDHSCWRENLDGCRDWSGKCPYHTLCEFGDSKESRAGLFTVATPKDKFETLNAAKRKVPAEDVFEQTIHAERGVETKLGG